MMRATLTGEHCASYESEMRWESVIINDIKAKVNKESIFIHVAKHELC